jgi:hypothetical protein
LRLSCKLLLLCIIVQSYLHVFGLLKSIQEISWMFGQHQVFNVISKATYKGSYVMAFREVR